MIQYSDTKPGLVFLVLRTARSRPLGPVKVLYTTSRELSKVALRSLSFSDSSVLLPFSPSR